PGVRSKIRPPGRCSSTTVASGSDETVWLRGHHVEIRAVQVSNACAREHWTSKLILIGSGIRGTRVGVLGQDREAPAGLAPDVGEIRADRLDALLVEVVHAAGALRLLDHQPRVLEQPQMPRYGRTADRQLVGELPHRAATFAEQLDDRAAIGVAEGVERVAADPRERISHAARRAA